MTAIRKILVPTDFSPHAAKAMDYAVFLAKALGAKIDVFHAYEAPLVELTPYHLAIPLSVLDGVRDAAHERLEAGDRAQDRRLARAGRSEQGEDLAGRDREGDVVDGVARSACVAHAGPVEAQQRIGYAHLSSLSTSPVTNSPATPTIASAYGAAWAKSASSV